MGANRERKPLKIRLSSMQTFRLLCVFASLVGCSSSSSSGSENAPGSDASAVLNDSGAVVDAGTTVDATMGGGTTDGGPADAGLPPIDASVYVSALTNTQLGQLCDWANANLD